MNYSQRITRSQSLGSDSRSVFCYAMILCWSILHTFEVKRQVTVLLNWTGHSCVLLRLGAITHGQLCEAWALLRTEPTNGMFHEEHTP